MQVDRTGVVSFVLVLIGALIVLAQQALAADGAEVARVVGIRGAVSVQSPGEAARPLGYDGVVRDGDTVATSAGAGVGLLAGSHYVGLDEGTTATIGRAANGAPEVQVATGRARVLDSGDGAPARLGAGALLAANAGGDTDAFAFAEKGGLVSMICPTEGPVTAARGGEALTPGPGDCAVAKAGEPLYPAKAGHDPLELLAQLDGFDPATSPVAMLGRPLPPVALGLGPTTTLATSVDPFGGDPRLPCDSPAQCAAAVTPPAPPNPPVNPPMPGGPPGGPPLP
ncbi:MAG: hypothetical protein R3E88_08655 [Myxococcota bacterium]